jgi:hypothetical protein
MEEVDSNLFIYPPNSSVLGIIIMYLDISIVRNYFKNFKNFVIEYGMIFENQCIIRDL